MRIDRTPSSGEHDRGRATYSDASSRAVSPTAPEWFHEALARPRRSGEVVVDGAVVRYLAWDPALGAGDPAAHEPAVVLVHGGAAHAMWWAPLAALLAPGRTVVAMDMSGHGTSDRRDRYTVQQWAREIASVATAVSEEPPVVIGHSLGGIVLSYAALEFGERFERVVLVDSPVWNRAPAPEGELAKVAGRPSRSYPDLASAMARFRLMPPQSCANDWYVDHIARHSLTCDDDGWRWRFDPQIFANPTGDHRIVRFEGDLEESRCPWAVVMGADSYLAAGALTAFEEHPTAPLRMVAGAQHHVMLDQPTGLMLELQHLLATWR